MTAKTPKKKTILGSDPLSTPTGKGIFQKTAEPEAKKKETRSKKPETVFLKEDNDRELDKVTLRMPIELNDWLDDLLKQGKRKHGQKIPQEVWVQAAIGLIRVIPADCSGVQVIDQMRGKLHSLEDGIQSMESRNPL
jgi:hypothetical protein